MNLLDLPLHVIIAGWISRKISTQASPSSDFSINNSFIEEVSLLNQLMEERIVHKRFVWLHKFVVRIISSYRKKLVKQFWKLNALGITHAFAVKKHD